MLIDKSDAIAAWGSHYRVALDADRQTVIQEALGPASENELYRQYPTEAAALASVDGDVPVIELPDEIRMPATLDVGDTVFVTENASAPIQETTVTNVTMLPADSGDYDFIVRYSTESGHGFASQSDEFSPRTGQFDKPGVFFETRDDAIAWQDQIQGMQPAAVM